MITVQETDFALERLFRELSFPGEPAGLYDPLRYTMSLGGKRLRPRLYLLVYGMFGRELGSDVLEGAAALELFHAFTLLHDDIMDRSPLRRGAPTVWHKWDPNTAILSGDVLCLEAYKHLAKLPAAVLGPALELFTTTAAQVCEGQQLDMDFEKLPSVPMEQYMRMIGLKTSVLLGCATGMGALVGGATPGQVRLLYDFGYKLGLAFQLEDDWLDTYGDSAVFGKPIGGDILNAKKTWLTVRTLEKGFGELSELFGTVLPPAEKIARAREIYARAGVEADIKAEIVRLGGEALHSAEASGIGPEALAVLGSLTEKLSGRNA